jgi:exosome complex protein LRP1
MDPQNDLPDLVEDLEVNIDELSAVLKPLLDTQLSTTASSLPLLDKAKLYVLAAYSIESLLYSALQTSGVNAKEHAIFQELARLKGYFGKIKSVEERSMYPAQPKAKLDVGAAQRFIKHGLAGNDKYDLERAERMAKERARAKLKAQQINKKFDEEGQEKAQEATPKKRDIEEVVAAEAEDEEEVLAGLEDPETDNDKENDTIAVAPAPKKPKLADSEAMDIDSASPAPSQADSKKPRKSKRGKKKSKSAETSDADESQEPSQETSQRQEDEPTSARPKRNQRGKKGKNSADEAEQETATPTRTTRSRASNAAVVEDLAEKPKRGRGRPKKTK